MKLSQLADVLKSQRGMVQFGIIYDRSMDMDADSGSTDYLVKEYGNSDVYSLQAEQNKIVICVTEVKG